MATQEITEQYVGQLQETLVLFEERIAELEFAVEDEGWIRQGGGCNYELTRDHLVRIVARARLFFLHNPLINRAVNLQADYVFAQGVNIQATDKDVNAVIQDFLDDRRNVKEFTGHQARLMKEQTLMVDGNVFFVLFTNKATTGRVQLRTILVDEIVDIVCNPDDQNEVWYYKREWQSRSISDPTKVETNIAYYPDIDYLPDSTTRLNGSYQGKPVYWDAPIYHIKVGQLSKSRYGVPEVYAALDWANAHKNFLENWSTIVKAYAMFAFKLTVAGGKNAVAKAKSRLSTTVGNQGQAVVESNPTPVTGSIFTKTKDGADIEPIKTAGATTSAKDGREIRLMVAAAMGIPDTMLSGDADTGNLATAKTLDRPTELKFRSRQQLWTDVCQDIITYVIKWAAIAPQGRLKGKVKYIIDVDGRLNYVPDGIDTHVEVTFPPLLEHSVLDRINAISNAVTLNGKQFAIESEDLAKLTTRLMLQALGVKDVDEIVAKIFKGSVNFGQQPQPNEQPTNGTTSGTDTRVQA